MRTAVTVLSLALIGCAPIAAQATPEGPESLICLPRTVLLTRLEKGHNESPQVIGLTADGLLMEITGSPSGTWTLFATRPDGTSCLISVGEDLTIAAPVPVGNPT